MDNQSLNQEMSDSCPHEVFNPGCGCADASGMVLNISPTTGGQFSLQVRKTDSIDHLKKVISKKLKVLRERICLLYRERQLITGSLQENGLADGCRLILLPMVETGLTTQKPEISVMNALESLNESQVHDFLSGKAPLNLTMRLGDHMMLIQLMLSTFSNQNPMSVASSSKPDDFPSTSTFISSSKSFQPDTIVAADSNFVENTATAAALSSTRLENILTSQSISGDLAASTSSSELSTSNDALEYSPSPNQTKNSSTTYTRCSSSPCTCRLSSCAAALSYGVDSIPLAKATRNLTQTLQKLSSEVLTSKRTPSTPSKYKSSNNSIMQFNRKPNAILENMEHHGRGIYSGTFSGTLNPALQDRFGRPKKDVSTIIHILNDLLCAEPRGRCKASCNCGSASLLEKATVSSSSGMGGLSACTIAERTLDTVEENISCDTTTVIPVSVDKATFNSFRKMNENQTTRSKMEQLKSMMGVRKEKRKERRFSPYDKRISAVDVISSATVNPTEPWSAVDSTTSSEPTDPASILSKAVIA